MFWRLVICTLTCAILACLPETAFANLFRNSYISFTLPPSWNCKADGADWICTNSYSNNAKEAMIIFTAKEAGPADTLIEYQNHLKIPKSLPDLRGQFHTSTVEDVRQRKINGQTWIDGLQLGSEVTKYYTRYLATTKDRVAILVTFSAHKDYYTKYSADFINAISSLQVVAAKDILANQPKMIAQGGNETIGSPITPEPFTSPTDVPPAPTGGRKNLASKLFALALILAAAGIYLWRKKKKKQS